MRKKEKRGHYLQTPAVRKSSLPLCCTFLPQAFHFWEKKKITNIILMNENPVLPCRLVCVKLLFFSHWLKPHFTSENTEQKYHPGHNSWLKLLGDSSTKHISGSISALQTHSLGTSSAKYLSTHEAQAQAFFSSTFLLTLICCCF